MALGQAVKSRKSLNGVPYPVHEDPLFYGIMFFQLLDME
jgi:hypothetical protein